MKSLADSEDFVHGAVVNGRKNFIFANGFFARERKNRRRTGVASRESAYTCVTRARTELITWASQRG